MLSLNNICTSVGPTEELAVKQTLKCNAKMRGRYVTLQSRSRQRFQFAEINFIVEKVAADMPNPDVPKIEKTFVPSLCTDNGDPYCDPNWTPFANMNMALMGYDIVNSDPLADGGDPGFKSQIFGAVVTDDAGRMVLSDGIAAVDMLECKSNFDSKTASTLSVRNWSCSTKQYFDM